ncbi:MAG TPA: S8 family serine peptidase, partial [Candidatus Hydrogenedentes bacterium]|nr:S8 family serine peptidase [Candidatus Hydrogenedentota bacterium]
MGIFGRGVSFVLVLIAAIAAVPLPATGQGASPSPIEWKNSVSSPGGAASAAVVLGNPAPRHVVVQFGAPLKPGARESLRGAGLDLLAYLGSNAYFAAFSGADKAADAASAAGMVAAQEILPAQKMHPRVAAGDWPAHAAATLPTYALGGVEEKGAAEVLTVAVYVVFHEDVDQATAGAEAVARHGGAVKGGMTGVNAVVAWLPAANVAALAAEDCVQWIEPVLPKMGPVNDSNRVVTQADAAQTAPYNLDGTGVNVLVYDAGTARGTHLDFGGRLTVRDGSGMIDHATHVAGTVGGSGAASGGTYRGMAPGVTIQSYGFEDDGSGTFLYTNPGDIEADYTAAVNTYGAVIANNSIGTNTAANGFPCEYEGDYGVTDQVIDALVRGSLGSPMRIVWANGNERGNGRCGTEYHTTAPPACAKNHITVGALNSNNDTMTSFSSWGPTDDGRIKPDISGPGCQSNDDGGVTSCDVASDTAYTTMCGTSMAAPTVTGLCALILQDFKALHPADPLPRNSTLKVLLAHNAVDVGNIGPDYLFGYGSVRVTDTIDFMRGGSFREDSLDQGEAMFYIVPVTAGDPFLKVTVAWDDAPGAVNTIPELVNDLDLTLTAPDGTTVHYPWTLDPANPSAPAVQTQADHRNNIEQVFVNAPAEGNWIISVAGTSVPSGPQVFSLAASPALYACTSAGILTLDRAAYRCEDTLGVTVNDCDLDADPGTVETVTVTVASTTEPAGETVVLTETGMHTATFTGSLPLSAANAPGTLQTAGGDTLTASYVDAD